MNKIKVNHPHILMGVYFDWLSISKKHSELNHIEFRMLYAIAKESFGYLQQYTLLSYIDLINKYHFSNRNAISKTINLLLNKNLIEKSHTFFKNNRGKNKYKIVLPQEILDNYEIYWKKKNIEEQHLQEFIAKFTNKDVATKIIEQDSITEKYLKNNKDSVFKQYITYFNMNIDEYNEKQKSMSW